MYSTRNITEKFRSLLKKKYSSQIDSKSSYNCLAPTEQKNSNPKPRLARRGCVAVYVGEESKRYEVPLQYLSIRSFQELILQWEHDDLDTKIEGPIKLLCSTAFFEEQLLKLATESM
ncbi:hypothetical protein P3X46_005279 [Hevea brasiliensis]|uniref:SAUR family protein n=1 Tax=Hevea brasiliensis TaxID=3981 RepID=A0ABQ9N4C5_HEVBR|nr:hypothetical protein P3X46_005279 [Hevea brasiliensis]